MKWFENSGNDCKTMRGGTFLSAAFLCFFSISSFSQNFSSLSKYEKRWAVLHPIASLKLKKHRAEMLAVYNEVKNQKLLDNFENGGKLDAFRHVFAMAYFSDFVSVRKLRKLGRAHEKGNYLQFLRNTPDEGGELVDSVSCLMDLKNNEVGFTIHRGFGKMPVNQLKQKVIDWINLGSAFIIKRNTEGLYVDCGGNIISRNAPYKKWGVPKCLIPSNN